MVKIFEYYSRFQGVRGQIGGLPTWARGLIFIAALPGILLLSLSILAVLVSILALLLLTVPTYRLMQLLTGTGVREETADREEVVSPTVSTGRRHIDVKIVE